MKTKGSFVCEQCGYNSSKWLGQCPSCSSWNSFVEESLIEEAVFNESLIKKATLAEIHNSQMQRLSTGFEEFDRVLGGGIVPASVILISGEPGIGKSTLLLRIVSNLVKNQEKVTYLAAEESIEQVGMRAERILDKDSKNFTLLAGNHIEQVIQEVKKEKIKTLIVDSIQAVYSQDSKGLPGSLSQVRTVAAKLVSFAKQEGVTIFIVGQINKEGYIAGPKLLEHAVDVVLQLEGDEQRGFRVLRSLKNRFGATGEVGLFEMTDKGFIEITNPFTYFLENSDEQENSIGICPVALLEGNRIIIFEVQALAVKTSFALPKRVAEGISKSKLEVLAAIVDKYGRLRLGEYDLYVNISGGVKVKDPALDLAIVLAIASSIKNVAVPKKLVVFGEVSLTGQIKTVTHSEMRKKEIGRMGYKTFADLFPKIHTISALIPALK